MLVIKFGDSQCVCLRPMSPSCFYVAELFDISAEYGVTGHQYADEKQIYIRVLLLIRMRSHTSSTALKKSAY